MLLIDNLVVHQILEMRDCIEVQEEAFKGLITHDSVHRGRIDLYLPCERPDGYYRWGTMEGGSSTLGVVAIRMKSDIITWPQDEQGGWTEDKYCTRPGLYCGLIFLLSTRTGEPLAIIQDGVLQHMRVGGGAGIGAKHLSRQNARVVGMLGSGGMARTFLRAFRAVRDIRQVRVYSPNPDHRAVYAAEMSQTLGIEVTPVDDPRKAVNGADIVSTCTDSMAPVIDAAWLQPGQHVTSLNQHEMGPGVNQLADVVIRQGDSGTAASDERQRVEVGRGHSPIAFIAGSEEEIQRLPPATPHFSKLRQFPTFTDLVSGAARGRASDRDITVYHNVGYQGLQFAAVGALAYRKAREKGLGRELPTEWFLQDIRD